MPPAWTTGVIVPDNARSADAWSGGDAVAVLLAGTGSASEADTLATLVRLAGAELPGVTVTDTVAVPFAGRPPSVQCTWPGVMVQLPWLERAASVLQLVHRSVYRKSTELIQAAL